MDMLSISREPVAGARGGHYDPATQQYYYDVALPTGPLPTAAAPKTVPLPTLMDPLAQVPQGSPIS